MFCKITTFTPIFSFKKNNFIYYNKQTNKESFNNFRSVQIFNK